MVVDKIGDIYPEFKDENVIELFFSFIFIW